MITERSDNFFKELEQEITGILTDSSLYPEMSESDKQNLLRYLVTVYFRPLSSINGRAHPKVIQIGPAT